MLIAFCGTREIGSDQDSIAYFTYFNLDEYGMSLVAEPTFIWIAKISRIISEENGFRWLLFIYAILGVTLKMVAIRRYSDLPWLAIITYISYFFLLHEFTQIRAGVATGLVLLSIKYILDRDFPIFFTLIAIASMFHYSAMVVAPLYFISFEKLNLKRRMLLAMTVPAGILLSFPQIDFINTIPIDLIRAKVAVYTEAESLRNIKLNVFNLFYLIKYLLLYVYIILSSEIEKNQSIFP